MFFDLNDKIKDAIIEKADVKDSQSTTDDRKKRLTHFDVLGNAIMVDVSDKAVTIREAVAEGKIVVNRQVLESIRQGTAKKGDVLGVARIAAIMAAKRTSDIIPLCHPLPLTKITVDFAVDELEKTQAEGYVITARCSTKTDAKTGVEMEALTGVQVALLTIYDMCKAIDKRMVMTDIHLVTKTGGKSGNFVY